MVPSIFYEIKWAILQIRHPELLEENMNISFVLGMFYYANAIT